MVFFRIDSCSQKLQLFVPSTDLAKSSSLLRPDSILTSSLINYFVTSSGLLSFMNSFIVSLPPSFSESFLPPPILLPILFPPPSSPFPNLYFCYKCFSLTFSVIFLFPISRHSFLRQTDLTLFLFNSRASRQN